VPLAGSTADAPDDATKEPSATQSPLNLRRFSNCIFSSYTFPFTVVLGWHMKDKSCSLAWSKLDGGAKFLARGDGSASPRLSFGCVPTPCTGCSADQNEASKARVEAKN
jgi:hypothetical protein